MAEALRQILSRTLAKQLFPDNAFYQNALRDGGSRGIAIDAEVVTIPQEGNPPDVVVDPTTFPVQEQRRPDLATTYNTHLFATVPTIIQDDEELLTNYNKQQSVLQGHANALNTQVADRIAYEWAKTSGKFFLTTSNTARPASAPGATGNRKKIAKEDIRAIAEWFDKNDIPAENRFALLPSDMYYDLLDIAEFVNYSERGLTDLIGMGIIGEIFGFRIMKRSRVVNYDMTDAANPVLRAIGSAGGANDSLAGIFWQETTARYAYGAPVVYLNQGQANYYGSVLSTAVRSGGRASYEDGKGVAVLIQDIAV